MANMHLVTGYGGAPHVTAADQGSLYAAIFGAESFVLSRGNKLAATVVSNNLISIADGDIIFQGRHGRIEPGMTVDLIVENGTAEQNRNDLIVARYTKASDTGIERIDLVVLKGTPTNGTAADPECVPGNILDGAAQADFPLYRVPLNGLNIQPLVPLFSVFATIPTQAAAAVSINPQALNESQQAQARENIGAAATANLAGCWIDFTDENGNPTDEPYLHWEEGGDGKKPDTTFSELLAAVGNAVSVEAQGFTEAQKAQARANIGAAAVGAGGGAAGNAVLYDKQTLTDAQKAQARENINADKPEKWVELADITTTEAVSSITVNTDKNGQPFVCKKLIAKITWGGDRSAGETWWGSVTGRGMFGDNTNKTHKIFLAFLESSPGQWTKSTHSILGEGGYFWQDESSGTILNTAEVGKTEMAEFYLRVGDGSATNIPANTNVKLWGVLA
jgi:hypothetical protein